MPKSATHKKVRKNGIDGWIVNEVWDKMEEEGNLQGWEAVADTPVEVQLLKQKTKAVADTPVEEVKAAEEVSEEVAVVDDALTAKVAKKK